MIQYNVDVKGFPESSRFGISPVGVHPTWPAVRLRRESLQCLHRLSLDRLDVKGPKSLQVQQVGEMPLVSRRRPAHWVCPLARERMKNVCYAKDNQTYLL